MIDSHMLNRHSNWSHSGSGGEKEVMSVYSVLYLMGGLRVE